MSKRWFFWLALALAVLPTAAWAGDVTQAPFPDAWLRILIGVFGGVAHVAQQYTTAPLPEWKKLGIQVAVEAVLGAAAGFAVVAAPVVASSQDMWLVWCLVAGFSGNGLLGALTGRLQIAAQARALTEAHQAVVEAHQVLDSSGDSDKARAILAPVARKAETR